MASISGLSGYQVGRLVRQWNLCQLEPLSVFFLILFFNSIFTCMMLLFIFLASKILPLFCSYQVLMRKSSRVPLFDLRKLNASLPVHSVPKGSMEILVIGASNDFIVDAEGLEETARFYGVQPVCVEGVAHDMMLDSSWERCAETILSWFQSLK